MQKETENGCQKLRPIETKIAHCLLLGAEVSGYSLDAHSLCIGEHYNNQSKMRNKKPH